LSGMTAHATALKASADVRERYQIFNNFDFNSLTDRDAFELDSRLYLKFRADFSYGLSVYVQPQAVLIRNTTKTAGTQSLTQSDLYQAYLQYKYGGMSVRLGRQTLVYGDQRLLGHLGWKDVARTFDGVKALYHQGAVKMDAFAVHPADIISMTPTAAKPHGQSLVTWEDRRLIGVYATYTILPKTGVDAYFINWRHNQYAAVGKGRNINTFGARLFGKWNGFDATGEYVRQQGTWKNGVSQQADALAVKAGHTFGFWKTRLGVEFDYSPGDDKANPVKHKNFVFPFHTNHMHYGEMDRFSWANMKDVRLSLKTSPISGMSLIANTHLFWLADARGDWLNVVGTGILFSGNPAFTQTRAGTEVDVKLVYKAPFLKGLKLVGLYGLFNPGAAVRERNGGAANNANFGYIIANYVF